MKLREEFRPTGAWYGWRGADQDDRCDRGHRECARCGHCACDDGGDLGGRVTKDSLGHVLCTECRRERNVGIAW